MGTGSCSLRTARPHRITGSRNFFEGGVTGVVGSNGTDYPERTYTGSWGGQFFRDNNE